MHASTLPYLAARRLARIILPLVGTLLAFAATAARAYVPVFDSMSTSRYFPRDGSSSNAAIYLAEPLPSGVSSLNVGVWFGPSGLVSLGMSLWPNDPNVLEYHIIVNSSATEWERHTIYAVSERFTDADGSSHTGYHTEASTDIWVSPFPLGMSSQPSGAVSGQPLTSQPTVAAYWGWGRQGTVFTDFNGYVTASLQPNTGTPGAKLTGTVVVEAVNGIATFTDLAIDKPGEGYVLTFDYQSYVTSGASAVGGHYFSDTSVGSAPFNVMPAPVYGDADGDGRVTVPDAVKTLRLPAGLGTAGDIGLLDVAPRTAPGVYGDGKVDLLDVARILRHASGLETEWPG